MSNFFDNEANCTIITKDYIHYALALHDSLLKHSQYKRTLYILICSDSGEENTSLPLRDSMQYLFVDEVCKIEQGKLIYDKYFHTDMDKFRWSMKPVLLKYLIEYKNCNRVLFLDCDLYFFNNYDFLFERLHQSDILLTPHWRPSEPDRDPDNFHALIPHGLFNAGFIGVTKNAFEALTWWARACEYSCEIDAKRGIYVDQGYLTAFPVLFNNVEILKHQGCNVAEWNIIDCRRTPDDNNNVLINNTYPIIFIHFTTRSVKRIADGRDPFLINHLSEYFFTLYKYDKDYNILLKVYQLEPDIIEKPVYVGLSRIISKLKIVARARKLFSSNAIV